MSKYLRVSLRDLVVAWSVSTLGFLLGQYGGGWLLLNIREKSGVEAMLEMAWMPWLFAPCLAAIGGILALLPRNWGHATVWDWSATVIPVPVVALLVTVVYAMFNGVHESRLWVDGLTQVAISLLLGILLGFSLKARVTKENIKKECDA